MTDVYRRKNIQSYVFQSTSQLLADSDWQNIWMYSWSLHLLLVLPLSAGLRDVTDWNGLGASRQFCCG